MASSDNLLPQNSRIVQPAFLEKHSNKKDLVKRLRALTKVLETDPEVDVDSLEWPGLNATAALLVTDEYLQHADKEVRLYTVTACMELFAIYAPEAPWNEREMLLIFRQTIRQLASLAHTTQPSQANYANYLRILNLLADVEIGVVLVELAKNNPEQLEEEEDEDEQEDGPDSDCDRDRDHADGMDMDSESGDSDDGESDTKRKNNRKTKNKRKNNKRKNNTNEEDTPLELLADLIKTLLHSVRNDHAPQILELVEKAIVACLNEYNHGMPIKILDEILSVIGQGPVVLVTNPAAAIARATDNSKDSKNQHNKRSKQQRDDKQKLPPMQVEQSNPSYVAAAGIVRQTLNKTATPIAALLNGLLNNDTHICQQSSISADLVEHGSVGASSSSCSVWNIVYELHRVAPQILTTVIGTVSNGLTSPDTDLRLAVCQLLGRLFYAKDSRLATQFAVCFREWLGRQQDVEQSIRRVVCQSCVRLIDVHAHASSASASASTGTDVCHEADACLMRLVQTDPALDVRLEAIHLICDLAYRKGNVSAKLLRAVGSRVSAKHKQERRDALTGLGQIYYRHFTQAKLKNIQAAGDDCDLSIIRKVLHEGCHLDRRRHRVGSSRSKRNRHADDEMDFGDDNGGCDDAEEEKYGWIPRKVFESACFGDQTDPDMRSRAIQIMDDMLLGSDLPSTSSSKKMTPTAKAVGLAMIIDSLRKGGENLLTEDGSSNAIKYLNQLLKQRASLQKTLSAYIDARAKIRECESGSEEALAADAKAISILEVVASLTPPVSGSGSGSKTDVLKAFHGARDKHIFRILGTITNPAHSTSARGRALDELPKRTKTLGDAVSNWVKNLVRRCAMGDFLNVEVVNHCVLIAQECFFENDVPACGALLACVKIASSTFPALCGTKKTFTNLTELFSECRTVASSEIKKEVQESGIVTCLSCTLSAAAPTRVVDHTEKATSGAASEDDLQSQLFQLCTRDGTPEQARNAVYTLARLLNPSDKESASSSSKGSRRNDEKAFSPLLKALTSPTRMTLSSNGDESSILVSALSALAAFADCAPDVFGASERGDKAVKFALETILMGVNHADDSDSDVENEASDRENHDEGDSPSSSRKKRPRSASKNNQGRKNLSPEAASSLLEDESLSVACRRVCAAIDFLVSFVRSSVLELRRNPSSSSRSVPSSPSPAQVKQIFELMTQILHDKGLPPSNRDRRACKSRQDRAALRHCAAIHLLRLCDSRLGLEKKYFTAVMWHTLSEVFLDEERVVREVAMEELSLMLSGSGIYGVEGSRLPAQTPSLRFVSLVVLCTDGDHGADHDGANGNAANVGKLATQTKTSVLNCIVKLRNTCDDCYTRSRSMGKETEKKFENYYKMLLMPEYVVPFSFHLLALRRETPSVGGGVTADVPPGTQEVDDSDVETRLLADDDESQQRVLRKRLKWLFEPLVQSLGDSADNISFLLRMTEILGKQYMPVDAFPGHSTSAPSPLRLSTSPQTTASLPLVEFDSKRGEMLEAKLKTICVAAREVLLSFVKKDVNLTTYPGTIQIPALLFKKSSGGPSLRMSQQSVELSQSSPLGLRRPLLRSPKANTGTLLDGDASVDRSVPGFNPSKFLAATGSPGSGRKSRVHFSPELEVASARHASSLSVEDRSKHEFDGLSPIAMSKSPTPRRRSSRNKSVAPSNSADSDTLGSTPPSVLRGATIRSTAPEGATDEESPESKMSSPVVQSEIRNSPGFNDNGGQTFDDEDGDGIKTTSETQSTQETSVQASRPSKTSGSKKRKPSQQESQASQEQEQEQKPKKRKQSSIPLQIKINRSKAVPRASDRQSGGQKKRRGAANVDDLDFDFADTNAPENQPVQRNRSKKSPRNGGKSSKTVAAAAKTTISSGSDAPRRALRTRRS